MNVQPNPQRTDIEGGDLDARILRAERRLAAREDSLHRNLQTLGTRLKRSLQPRRWLPHALVAGGTLTGLMALRALFRRHRGTTLQGQGAAAGSPRGGHRAAASWVPLIGLGWPMLPTAWRARLNPTLARLVLGTGLPWLEGMLARQALPPAVSMGPVDRGQLMGLWYELGRHPRAGEGKVPLKWRHRLRRDGAIELLRESVDGQGRETARFGVAKAVARSGDVLWQLSQWPAPLRWLAMAWHREAVLHLSDAELLLGSPDRTRLRLLARQPHLPRDRVDALLMIARQSGFAAARLHFMEDLVSPGGQCR